MIDIIQNENIRLKKELATLRQIILRIEPMVLWDGRFEQMICTPIETIQIAGDILATMPARKKELEALA